MECPFTVGDEVVCVDAHMEDIHGRVCDSGLTLGRLYTISSVHVNENTFYHAVGPGSLVVVSLAEVPYKAGYHWKRFRKAVKQDISVFKEMLVKPRVKVTEDA